MEILRVLGLAGMESIFFRVAHGVLGFQFVTRAVLTRHQWFSYC